MKVALSSKRMNSIIPRATTYESRVANEGFYRGRGHFDKLVHQLNRRDSKLQRYQHASMTDCYAFKFNRERYNHCKNPLAKRINRNGPRIAGITSLDLLFSSYLLPSLRELDFTNNMGVSIDIVGTFFRECSRLEKVTYRSMTFYLDGRVMKSANNL